MEGLDWHEYAARADAAIAQVVLTDEARTHLRAVQQEADCPEQAKLLLCLEEKNKLYVGMPIGVHTCRYASLQEYDEMVPDLQELTFTHGFRAPYLHTDNRILTGSIEPPNLETINSLKQTMPGLRFLHYHTHARTSDEDLRILERMPENEQQLQMLSSDIKCGVYDFLSADLGRQATLTDVISYESCTKPSMKDLETMQGTTFAIITQMCAPTLEQGVLVFRGTTLEPDYAQRIPVTTGEHEMLKEAEQVFEQRSEQHYEHMSESFAGALALLRAHELPDAQKYLSTPLARSWAAAAPGLEVKMDPYAPWWTLENAIVEAVQRKHGARQERTQKSL